MRIEVCLPLIFFGAAWTISLLGTWALCRHFKRGDYNAIPDSELPGISILKPLKGLDEGLKENLKSFFELNYPRYELLFSAATVSEPALACVGDLMAEYPHIAARTYIGGSLEPEGFGDNPKINNLAQSYEHATYEHLLISDSNVRVAPDYLRRMVPELRPDVGIVTGAVVGFGAQSAGGILESGYLSTFYARWMFLAKAFGFPLVIGKSMFFRKTTFERIGGLRSLRSFIAEDYMAGYAVRQLALKVELLRGPVKQYLGSYSFRQFWERHIRWGRIRKSMAPLAFIGEILISPFLSSALGTFGLWATGNFSVLGAFSLCAGLWWILDSWSLYLVGEWSGKNMFYFWIREGVIPVVWVSVLCGDTVNWRGRFFKLNFGGTLSAVRG